MNMRNHINVFITLMSKASKMYYIIIDKNVQYAKAFLCLYLFLKCMFSFHFYPRFCKYWMNGYLLLLFSDLFSKV